jgi:hypothetical protein
MERFGSSVDTLVLRHRDVRVQYWYLRTKGVERSGSSIGTLELRHGEIRVQYWYLRTKAHRGSGPVLVP